MFPKLYKSDETNFTHNGLGLLTGSIAAVATEELNGMFELRIEYDSEGFLVDEIKEEMIIKAKANDEQDEQLFRIYSITKNHENDNLIIDAQHITYDLANNFVEKMEAINVSKKQVMELIGSSTAYPHPFNLTSTNTTTHSSTSLYRTNPLQMIGGMDGSVLQIWGGQIERDNFNLIMHDRRGSDDGVLVTYKKNLTGLEAVFDISGLVTRIFPFVFIEATEDEPERLITVSGKYIDSPLINDYKNIYIEPIDYSSDERINTDGTDAQIRQQLTNLANAYFDETGNDKPKVTMEVKFEHLWETEEYKHLAVLELVGMGDTVTVKHSKLNIEATAIVNRIEYDCIARKNIEVDVGNVKARFTDKVNDVENIVDKVEEAEQSANQAIKTANGKNTIYYGPDEPVGNIKKDDIWFKVVDGEYTRTYRYDGIQWQLVIDMDTEIAKEEAEEAKARADDAVDRANQATEEAQQAIDKAQEGFDLAQENATQIDSLGLQIGNVEDGLTTISGTVQGLQTTVSDIDGNVSDLTQLSNAMQTRLSDAEGNINELTLTSQSMQSTISGLQDEWDNLEIGGRNFALNSNELVKNESRFTYRLSEEISSYPVTKFTVSFDMKYTGEDDISRVEIYFYNGEFLSYAGGNSSGNRESTSIGGLKNEGKWHRYEGAIYTVDDISEHSNVDIVTRLRLSEGGFSSDAEIRNMKVEKGNKATDWSPAPEDMATQSQITQLSDAINLRVEKDDVINQINLDTSGVLISGKKLILDGDTTVTGAFKVDNANIIFVDAGKITVGDLVGHSLVGGSVIGGYIEQQSGSNRVEIQNGIVSHFRNNELKSVMDGSGHSFYEGGNHIGNIGTSSWAGDSNYRGLSFQLENRADYMTWSYKRTPSATDYTTMLVWHKTNAIGTKGFTFNDNVRISGNYGFRNTYFITDSSTSRAISLRDATWNDVSGVDIRRDPNQDGGEGGIFLASSRVALTVPQTQGSSTHTALEVTRNYIRSVGIYNQTTSSTANVYISSNANLVRSTSSSKYKLVIENEEEKGYDYKRILNLNVKSWYDKTAVETYAEILNGNLDEKEIEAFPIKRHYGLIAEEVYNAGLSEFVTFNDDGEIEGIEYDRLLTLLIPIVREQQQKIEQLEREIALTKGEV